MSDAQAAQVTETGVPPLAQEKVDEAPGFKVFVGNLAYASTDEGLKALFAPFASDILSAQVILRPGPRANGNTVRSAGYGFVALATEEAATKATEQLDKKELDGRQVIVQLAKPSELKEKEKKEKKAKRRPGRRGSKAVPGEVSEAEANGEALKADGTAPESDDAAKPKKKKKSKSARKAKKAAATADGVEGLETPAAATAEGETATAEGGAKKARVRKPRAPRTPRPAGEDPAGEPSTTMLFVANLGFNVDDSALAALFTEAAINVISARVVCRRWGVPRKSKGYGFVDVGNAEEQQKAIAALDGKEVDGRAIAVKVAVNTPREETADEAAPVADGAEPTTTA